MIFCLIDDNAVTRVAPPALKDQAGWLREHGFLTKAEENYLAEVASGSDHPRHVPYADYVRGLLNGTVWSEF